MDFFSLNLLQLSLFICVREVAPGYCKSMVLQHQVQNRKEETSIRTFCDALSFPTNSSPLTGPRVW